MPNQPAANPVTHCHRQPLPLPEIADLLNRVDAGIGALMDLLKSCHGQICAEGLAALMQPHVDALRRASCELNDHH